MNIYRYFSDLHGYGVDFKRDTDVEEICLIAGDVTEFGKKGSGMYVLLEALCFRIKEVIMVPGNHEYYGSHIGTLERKLRELMDHIPNFTLLQSGAYVERDGVRIIGATLWSDTSTIAYDAEVKMNDYRCIRVGPALEPWKRKLKPKDTTLLHHAHVLNISEAIQSHDGPCIVMTHHAPSFKSIDPAFEGNPLNPAYATDIELPEWPDYWLHGHIHRNHSYEHNGCTVLCNPGGYQCEYTEFEPLTNRFTI